MKPLHDYFYRFPHEHLRVAGRCRVRIYKRKNGTHTVLLTELNNNTGESITSASERIATDLVARWELNPRTTRWIQHEPPLVFDEVEFVWDSDQTAGDPEWHCLDDEQTKTLTGASIGALNRRLGDVAVADGGGSRP